MEIRKPKLQPKRGKYRSYDVENLSKAYSAVKDQHMPVREAARRFGVPSVTLHDRISGKVAEVITTPGKAPMFSKEQESLLCSHIKTMAEVGYGYSRPETINLATNYAIFLGLRDKENPLTDRWLCKFLNRWSDLKVKKPRSLEIARAKSATRQAVDNYFAQLNAIMNKYDLHGKPHLLFNIDEKGLHTDYKPPRIVVGTNYKAQAVTPGKSKTVTVIGCCNGIGQQIPPYFVFPGARMKDSLLNGCTAGVKGTVTATGWSNTDVFETYMRDHLMTYLPPRTDNSRVLVLYDGHKSHVSIGLIEWAKENNIILFVLPPHCSHLLQPLDVSCFGPMEIAWSSACHRHLRETGGQVITRFDVCEIACKVYTQSITPKNILSAFRRCGIHPFNPDIISDDVVAPATTFKRTTPGKDVPTPGKDVPTPSEDVPTPSKDVPTPSKDVPTPNKDVPTPSKDATSAENFFEIRGGEILKNVKESKVRNTLSKVVGGKAITEDDILIKIKDHKANQKTPTPPKPKETPRKRQKSPVPSTSGLNQSKKLKTVQRKLPLRDHIDNSSDSELESDDDDETCIVCGKFSPPDLHKKPFLTIVKWGCCDKCNGWVHLSFCTTVRVLRRGDTFLCPKCC